MAVFHPLQHTHWLAGRDGPQREKGEVRQTRRWEECFFFFFFSHTPRLFPRSLSLPFQTRGDRGPAGVALRPRIAAVCLALPPPRCSFTHDSLHHARADRVRLERRAGEAARILPKRHLHPKRDALFRFVKVSIRAAGWKGGFTEAKGC